MQINKRISQLEKRLPYGAKKEIAKRTGISQTTITRFFQGKVSKIEKYDLILDTAIRIVDEIAIKHFRKLNEVLNR